MSLRLTALRFPLLLAWLTVGSLGCGAAAGPVPESDDVAVVAASGQSSPGCVPANGCAAGKYCAVTLGACSTRGACEDSPRVCPELVRPVCGCDGTSYDNECFAQQAGVSVDHLGSCPTGG
jgi:hypothetical protein